MRRNTDAFPFMETLIMTNQELLSTAYHAYNSRDMEAALKTMHPQVEWPNTMEGGYVSGHEGIRAYWSK